jgi:hypothetical protein
MIPSLSPERPLRKPNLFVIGAMKSGTTFFSRLLGQHPSIFVPSLEEPSYFVPPDQLRRLWPYMWEQGIWRSEEAYLRLFLPGEQAPILAEASTGYSKLPQIAGVPERIARFNDSARFIYLMRDPVERSISHYWHMVRFHTEHRPMRVAILSDPQFCDVSHYALQLRPYLALFGRKRIFVLTFEELTSHTAATMRRLYAWLGVDPLAATPVTALPPENVTPGVVARPAWGGVAQHLRQSPALRGIVQHLPSTVRRIAKRLTTVPVDRRLVDTSGVIDLLQPIQQRQTEELSAMLERDFPEWTTLYARTAAATGSAQPDDIRIHA